MRQSILIVAGIALAISAGYDAALAWSRSSQTAQAFPALANDPANRLRANEAHFVSPEALGAHRVIVRNTARKALIQAPLNPPALRQLALIDALDEGKNTERLLNLAQRTSRRDLTNELVFIESAVAKGQIEAAVSHYDNVLSVYPEMRSQLFPILSAAIEEPEISTALAARARRPWFIAFLRTSLARGANISAAMGLALSVRQHLPRDTYEELVATMAAQAVKRDAHGEAFRLVASLPGVQKDTLAALDFSGVTSDPRLAPFSWNLTKSESLTALLDKDNRLAIEIKANHTQTAAERITLLSPGSYRVGQKINYNPDDPKPIFGWDVSCLNGTNTRPLVRVYFRPEDTGSSSGWSLAIPNGCAAQRWRLIVTAAEAVRPSAIHISGMRLSVQ